MPVKNVFIKAIGLIVIAVLLFVPLPTNNLWWREAINSGHTLLFFFLSFVIHDQVSARVRWSNRLVIYIFVLLIGMLLGVVIEALQISGQRDASLSDIYRNLLGLMAGIFLIELLKSKKLTSLLLVIAVAGFLWTGLNPLLRLSWHYFQRHNAFPVIIEFDANWSSSFVRYKNARMLKVRVSDQQNSHLHPIQFYPGNYPGVSIIEPEPNWSGYGHLHLVIHSMNAGSYYMTLRVHDESHNQEYSDRFNKRLLVQPGLNAFSISLDQIRHGAVDRELDLKNIAGLILFSSKLKEPLQIAVADIVLIK